MMMLTDGNGFRYFLACKNTFTVLFLTRIKKKYFEAEKYFEAI